MELTWNIRNGIKMDMNFENGIKMEFRILEF
jgi:hypothetical protein